MVIKLPSRRDLFNGVAWIIVEFRFTPKDILSIRKYARFAIQKVAYLLHYLGVDGFRSLMFNLYINGPYSPELADTYFELARKHPDRICDYARNFRLEPRIHYIVKWFMKKRYWWMEIATTILMIRKRYPRISIDALYRLVKSAKPWIDEETFNRVYRSLEREELL